MEILSCHSNETTWATIIKDTIYVETNVMNMYAKFQLYSPYVFGGEDFEYFFENLTFMLPWQTIKFSDLDKIYMNRRGLLKKHFCRKQFLISAVRQPKIASFHFSHYKSMATISCHSNRSSYPIGTKKHNYSFLPSVDAIREIWNESASWLQCRSRLKMLTDGRTDGRTTDACLRQR